MPQLILLLDPEDPRAQRLLETLEATGFDAELAERVAEGEHLATVGRVDAAVFDPSHVGADFLGRLRRRRPSQILVAWTPGASSTFVAELLDAGADEAVHGGMAPAEIVARIGVALRRAGRTEAAALKLGALRIDAAHAEVTWEGARLPLTTREREVLHVLAESPARAVRRETLYRRVWGYAMPRGDRSVDVNVKRLRAKLAAAGATGLRIETEPGVGYRLEGLAHPDADRRDPVTAL